MALQPSFLLYFCTQIMEVQPELTLTSILSFLKKHDVFMLLNSNKKQQTFTDKYSSFDWLLAAGVREDLTPNEDSFDKLKAFFEKRPDWLFGMLAYDLKNETENLSSDNFDGIGAPLMHFFSPQHLFIYADNKLSAISGDITSIERSPFSWRRTVSAAINLRQRVSKEEYITNVNSIKEHIHRGDIYEMNYCMEFYAENAVVDPYSIYSALSESSPNPFSTFYRDNDIYVMSASPERFIKKEEDAIISQPMKGTIRRSAHGKEDAQLKKQLAIDPKEQSENVMIVDLVRNDLSRQALRGSVKVDELFGTYTFPLVHQMISTVSGRLKEGAYFTDVIRDAFPMGSMTGAPKISAMKLIEQYEKTKRGLYSGAIGYITPAADFDFNVVIRSIIYNAKSKYLSFMVGSAITVASDAEKEYEECLLKAKAMQTVLESIKLSTVDV